MGKYIRVRLTIPQIDALLVAATAMLAGEQGEGDFLCSSAVLERAVRALWAATEDDQFAGAEKKEAK